MQCLVAKNNIGMLESVGSRPDRQEDVYFPQFTSVKGPLSPGATSYVMVCSLRGVGVSQNGSGLR